VADFCARGNEPPSVTEGGVAILGTDEGLLHGVG
jgi:hypothetical protein